MAQGEGREGEGEDAEEEGGKGDEEFGEDCVTVAVAVGGEDVGETPDDGDEGEEERHPEGVEPDVD